MTIRINLKQLGKKKAEIAEADFFLDKAPRTVRELICEAVHTCVSEYNERVRKGENSPEPLTSEKIADMSEIGKIAFGINYGGREQDERKAVENALTSYEDGIIRIFIGENEAGALDDEITVGENDSVTFIKLAMLSGRMW